MSFSGWMLVVTGVANVAMLQVDLGVWIIIIFLLQAQQEMIYFIKKTQKPKKKIDNLLIYALHYSEAWS